MGDFVPPERSYKGKHMHIGKISCYVQELATVGLQLKDLYVEYEITLFNQNKSYAEMDDYSSYIANS